MQGTWDLGFTVPPSVQNGQEGFWRYQNGSNSTFTPGFLFAFVDNATRNSGMTLAPADPALRAQLKLAHNEGLIVTQVEPGSPAAAAGIHQNDLLVRMEQSSRSFTSLGNVQDLVDALKNRGEQVASLVLMRAGRQMTISVQPQVHASLGPVRPEPPTYWIGVAVSPVEPALRAQLQLPDNQGLIVVEVDSQSPAAKAGVRQFDIIRSVNGQTPPDAPSLTKMIQAHGEKTVVIELTREARPVHVELVPVRRHPGLQRATAARAPGLSDHVFRGSMVESKLAAPGGTRAFDTYGNLVGNVSDVLNLYAVPTAPPADPALTKRLDDLTAQIKELREAIDALTKAQGRGDR